jgi:tRNA 2-thiouridine synthesizing protein A
MATVRLDTSGLISPEPMLKLAVAAPDMKPGDTLEITGDSPTFEKDIRSWCNRLGKGIIRVIRRGQYKMKIAIQF